MALVTIGLTGGVGAGKSAVAKLLAERGAVIIDADALAREVVEPGTAGLAAVAEAFGADVLAADGSLDRPKLAATVFADPDARARLNGILHPLIRRRSDELAAEAPPGSVVIADTPLLIETGQADRFDTIIVVEAPHELRLERLERRGLPRDQALARMQAQASDEERRAAADELIVNDGTLEDLRAGVDALWERLVGG